MELKKFKKVSKYLAGLLAAGALISLAIFPALGMKADAPRFNFLAGDEELFTGARGGSSDWSDPITVNDGDTFIGRVYYHNGIVDSVAQNTRIKVGLPDALRAGTNNLAASISADNAETVTDTIIDGTVNGLSGLTINASENLAVDYVPGSVKWYPNARQTGAAQQPLLFGQNGSELFGANGLRIGDINGCWEYAGWVTFVARVSKVSVPGLEITKTVKNVSDNTAYGKSVQADQSDTVNFRIVVKNSGDCDLDPVKVFDQLPTDLAAVAGTGRLTNDGATAPFNLSDLMSATGVNLGLMAPNETATLTFDAVPYGTITVQKSVRNIAIAASGSLQKQDYADVVLMPGNVEIVPSKSAWNLTQNINAESNPAKPGDRIEYTLRTGNTGNAGAAYVVRDNISDILEYADVIELNGATVNSGVIEYPEAQLVAGGELINTFVVKVKNPLPANPQNGESYDYKMVNKYGNVVTVIIFKPVVVTKPELSIIKYVRNVTANEATFVKANTAYAGETLEYKIVFKNSGNGSADYIKITDVLPANVTLDTTSAAILGIDGTERAIAENIQNGYVLNTLNPGQEAYIRFRAVIGSGVAAEETLTNTACLTDNGKTISDTAQTVIKMKAALVKAPVPSLPRTGATDSIALALFAATGITSGFAVLRAAIKR